MPSGSHFSGSGGHFGGGGMSRGGGGHSGPSRGRGGSFHRGSRTIMFFGHPHYLSDKKSFAVTALFMVGGFILFVALIMIFAIVASNGTIRQIEIDYQYYQDMIKKAEADPTLIKEAKVVDHENIYGTDYWMYYYELKQDDGSVLKGHTFFVYSKEEIFSKYAANTIVQVAVATSNVNSETNSIEMSYKDKKLEDDGQYIQQKNYKRNEIIGIIVATILGAGCIVGAIFLILKSKDEEGEFVNEKPKSERRKCPYCGVKTASKDKCPNCGANLDREE